MRGDSTANGAGNLDVIVAVYLPDGTLFTTVDTGTYENFSFFAPQSGAYTVRVTGYEGDTGNLGDTTTLLDPAVVDEIKAGAI